MPTLHLSKAFKFGLLALALSPLLAHASGKQPEGAVCFYEHINYQGASFCTSASSSWVGKSWNDRISSVRLRDGATVTLFNDVNYGAQSLALTADNANLVPTGFNDLTSSFPCDYGSAEANIGADAGPHTSPNA